MMGVKEDPTLMNLVQARKQGADYETHAHFKSFATASIKK